MIEADSIRYLIEYMISIIASFLLLGMSTLLLYTRYQSKKSVFYTKMIKQWALPLLIIFIITVIARYSISYFYFPAILQSPLAVSLYTLSVIVGICLLLAIYVYSRKNKTAPFILYIGTFLLLPLSDLSIIFFIAQAFYEGNIPYEEILAPTFFLFLTRVLPYALIFSSLLYILITISRKNKDTFGRDYYVFALHYCIKIAYISSAILIALSIGNSLTLTTLLQVNLSFSFLFGVVFAIPSIIFLYSFFILRKIYTSPNTPLQYRTTFIVLLLLATIALYADIMAVQPYLL